MIQLLLRQHSLTPFFNNSCIAVKSKHLQEGIPYLEKTYMASKMMAECIPIQAANQQKVMIATRGIR